MCLSHMWTEPDVLIITDQSHVKSDADIAFMTSLGVILFVTVMFSYSLVIRKDTCRACHWHFRPIIQGSYP